MSLRLAAFCLLAALSGPALCQTAVPATEAAAQALATRIQAEIARLPPNVKTEEMEASIVFVISQQDYPDAVILRALDIVARK